MESELLQDDSFISLTPTRFLHHCISGDLVLHPCLVTYLLLVIAYSCSPLTDDELSGFYLGLIPPQVPFFTCSKPALNNDHFSVLPYQLFLPHASYVDAVKFPIKKKNYN